MSQANPYPNIGFNPVPGTPDDVTGLRTQINSAGTAVKDTNDLLKRLRNSNDDIWKGDAGNAFRSHFDNTLAQDLGYAQNSLERAVTVLDEWHTGLVGYRDTAKTLESEAAEARSNHAKAVTTLQQAESNPDLGLANQTFTDQNALAAAQSRLNAAVAQVHSANTSVDDAQNQINSIIERAKDLETEHDRLARKVAAELDAAAKDFAPSPPHHHWWDSITDAVKAIGKYIKDHAKQLHDILSGISAIAGLIALITPPPIDAIAGAVALVAGAGALAMDAVNPDVRKAFGDVFTGHFDNKKDWETIGGVGMDALGVIPGVKSVKTGVTAFREAGEASAGFKAFAKATQEPGFLTQKLDKIPLPASTTHWLEDFSQASKSAPGTALSGLELLTRSGKAGLGANNLGNNAWNLSTQK